VSTGRDERMAELREIFFESAQELLQALNDEALKLEKEPGDAEIVRTIRRIVHTLKGDAAACGYRELSELAHDMEDVLALQTASAHTSLPQVAFTAADVFGAILTAYRRRVKVPSTEPLRKMIHAMAEYAGNVPAPKKKLAGNKTSRSKTPATRDSAGNRREESRVPARARLAAWNEYEKLAIQKALRQGKKLYHVLADIDLDCGMPIAGRQLVQVALSAIGEILAIRPEAGASQAERLVEFAVASDKTAEQIAAKCQVPTVISKVTVGLIADATGAKDPNFAIPHPIATFTSESAAKLEHSPASQPLSESEDDQQPTTPSHMASLADNILRVDAERIDNVLNLVGELIIGKSMLQQTLNDFAKRFPKDHMRGKFADAMALQGRVLNDLQRSVMKIRMVPVEQLFRRFPRLIRDVGRQCGKQVELVISGQHTDLDKSILDAIAEPITHLIRNAVSHGIESAEERQRAGKSPNGTIRLQAYHQANQVVVEVRDDGQGINAERVKTRAVEQGMITAEAAAQLSESEILDLIFQPGLSTAEQITEVSGRGVGMDVVQSVLRRLKGTVEVETNPGRGTAFRLKLPLTLAIIKALLFRVEHRLYAIALSSVAEIARTIESEIHQVDNREILQLRNQVLPMVRLGRLPVGADHGSHKIFVLVITSGDKKFGLIVDQLEGEQELVIKALDDHAISTDLVSGASIMGDGRVVMILNLSAVVEHFSRSRFKSSGVLGSGMLLSHEERSPLGPIDRGAQA